MQKYSFPIVPIHEMKLSTVARLPTKHGVFNIQAILDHEQKHHVVLYKGEVHGKKNVPFRIHSQCLTSEVFGSLRCDCDEQLTAALNYFETENCGILVYLRQEGRGIGLFNKIEAYALQDTGLDTIEANHKLGLPTDSRTYEIAVAVLNAFEIKSVHLLTNNPEKLAALQENGIEVSQRIPIQIQPNSFNDDYLQAKKQKLSHFLEN